MDLRFEINDQAREKIALLEGVPQRMLRPLARAWGQGAQEVVGRAVRGRFTGKGPFPVSQGKLGVVTGRLRRSIRATAPQLDLSTGEVSVGFGSNVSYFGAHEFGSTKKVQVQAHTRRTVGNVKVSTRGRLTKDSQARQKLAAKNGRNRYAYVKAHGRKMNIPARRPLGTELESIQTRATMRGKLKSAMAAILALKP